MMPDTEAMMTKFVDEICDATHNKRPDRNPYNGDLETLDSRSHL